MDNNFLNFYFILPFLIIMSILDLLSFHKNKPFIPSILSTGYIIILLIIHPSGIFYGIIGFLLGIAIQDLGAEWGMADIKILAGTSIIASSLLSVFAYTAIVSVLGIVYLLLYNKIFHKFVIKQKNYKYAPFIPVFLFSFLIWTSLNPILKGVGI